MEINLLFYEQQIKKIDPEAISIDKGKRVRTIKYCIKRAREGVHSYMQTVIDGQYHSLANISLHSVCLDYRIRMSSLQLSDFSKLTQT